MDKLEQAKQKLKNRSDKPKDQKVKLEITDNSKEIVDALNSKMSELNLILKESAKESNKASQDNNEVQESIKAFMGDLRDILSEVRDNTEKEIIMPPDRSDEVIKAIKSIDVRPKVFVEQREYNLKALETILETLYDSSKDFIVKSKLKAMVENTRNNPLFVKVVDGSGRIVDLSKLGGGGMAAFHTGMVDSNGDEKYALVDGDGHQQVDIVGGNVTLDASDIEIGAVEIKDGASDTRASVELDSTKNAMYVKSETLATNTVLTNGTQRTQIFDSAGAELDFRQEAENVNAADHGILIFGRDYASTPDKYRMIRVSTTGYVETNVEGATNSQYIEPHTEDFDTSGGTENVTSYGIAVPASGGAGVINGDETYGLDVDITRSALPTGAATEATLGSVKTAVELIDNAISGSEMQVDVVGSLPAGTNNIGDVDIASIAAGDNNIGNVDLASAIPAGSNAIGKVIPSDYELAGNTLHVKKYYTSAGAATDGIIWSPAAGKRWYVTDIYIQVSADATVTLEDDLAAGDSPVWKGELAAKSGWSHSFTTPLFSGEDAADLLITTSAGNVYVTVTGYEV